LTKHVEKINILKFFIILPPASTTINFFPGSNVFKIVVANTNYKEQYKKLTSVKPKIKNGITNT
jgi:nitrate reductase alpha subunit